MPLIHNISIMYVCAAPGGQQELHVVEDAALVWQDDIITWIGSERFLPERFKPPRYQEARIDAKGSMLVPGLIDCCTQLAFIPGQGHSFDRPSSFSPNQARNDVIGQTRSASEIQLTQQAFATLEKMKALGITTADYKTGFGLDFKDEVKLLKVCRTLTQTQSLELTPGFFGASHLPPEFRNRRNEYIRQLTQRTIPYVSEHKLARFCDVFLDDDGFTAEEAITILSTGIDYGLIPRLHTDHHIHINGAGLATALGAVSVSYLEAVSDEGIAALADSKLTAVALPQVSLRQQKPVLPARRLIEAGVPLAIATGCNPVTAPGYHLPFIMSLACSMLNMSPAEVLKATTFYAAQALGLEKRLGSLECGKQADFSLIDASSVNHWLYRMEDNSCNKSWKAGRLIYETPNL